MKHWIRRTIKTFIQVMMMIGYLKVHLQSCINVKHSEMCKHLQLPAVHLSCFLQAQSKPDLDVKGLKQVATHKSCLSYVKMMINQMAKPLRVTQVAASSQHSQWMLLL